MRWIKYPENPALVKTLSKKLSSLHLSNLQIQMLISRGFKTEKSIKSFILDDINNLHPEYKMKDLDKAVDIIINSIKKDEKIVIYGDYDADGVCATTILHMALNYLGASVDYYIPNRFTEGYGMNINAVKSIIEDKKVDLLITVDNGITAINEVEYAIKNNVKVIITDHHSVQNDKIPKNCAIINPHQEDCKYPYKDLCGAGVAWKLCSHLFKKLNADYTIIQELLSYVAVATVADMVPLTGENRILVKEGLKLINLNIGAEHTNKGLYALMKATDVRDLTAEEIGFKIGPCINAAGRLKTANEAIKVFIDTDRVSENTTNLVLLNKERKRMTEECTAKAFEEIRKNNYENDAFLVVFVPDINEGIIGLVASAVKEEYQVPTLVFTNSHNCYKASGRGVEGHPVGMFDALMATKEYWIKGGGHKMACGVSIIEDINNLNEFRKRLNEISNKALQDTAFTPSMEYDFVVDIPDEKLISDLLIFEPTGMANPAPRFMARGLNIDSVKIIGENKNHIKFKFTNNTEGLGFGMAKKYLATNANKIQALYTPTINVFEPKNEDGSIMFTRKSIQLNLIDIKTDDFRNKTLLISSIRNKK